MYFQKSPSVTLLNNNNTYAAAVKENRWQRQSENKNMQDIRNFIASAISFAIKQNR